MAADCSGRAPPGASRTSVRATSPRVTSPARRIAAEVLLRVEQGGAFANLALDGALRAAGVLEPREAALATELTYGSLRWQLQLDRAIAAHSDRPPAELDVPVRIALRLSIPVFAEPSTRTAQQLRYKVERQGEQAWLVATNDGTRHAALRNIALTTGDGRLLKTDAGVSPYILPGATHRWAIVPQGPLPAAGTSLMMTAGNQAVDIRQPVTVVVRP